MGHPKGTGRSPSSPAHPTLQAPQATTAVGSLELSITAITVTQCVQLHSQLF